MNAWVGYLDEFKAKPAMRLDALGRLGEIENRGTPDASFKPFNDFFPPVNPVIVSRRISFVPR